MHLNVLLHFAFAAIQVKSGCLPMRVKVRDLVRASGEFRPPNKASTDHFVTSRTVDPA